jgi:hypothetical protein
MTLYFLVHKTLPVDLVLSNSSSIYTYQPESAGRSFKSYAKFQTKNGETERTYIQVSLIQVTSLQF